MRDALTEHEEATMRYSIGYTHNIINPGFKHLLRQCLMVVLMLKNLSHDLDAKKQYLWNVDQVNALALSRYALLLCIKNRGIVRWA